VTAVPSCQLCGSAVSIDGAVAVCPNCGAEYDVIRHGRRGDFSKSAEVAVGAKQYPTTMHCSLRPYPTTPATEPYPPGTVLYVGQTITVRMGIYSPDEGKYISPLPQNVTLWHKLDTGAWEKLWVGGWALDPAFPLFDWAYKLAKAGTHTFYAEWPGTDVYAGCEESVHGLADYAVSSEVSLEALPALTVIVKDMVFKKPIQGAKVVVDTNEAVTDSSGMAVFDMLAPGTYTLIVSARDYKSETRTVILTAAGVVAEVHLLHLAAIALGLVAVGSVGVVVVHQATKRK